MAHPPTAIENPLARLKATLDTLPPAARRIATAIITAPDRVLAMSVAELAGKASASEGSVVQLCQSIGARGFQELKIALAKEIAVARELLHEDIVKTDDIPSAIGKIMASNSMAIEETQKVLDPAEVGKAVNAMLRAKRIEIYGIGTAAPIAQDAAYRFMRLGLPTACVVDSHAQAVSASFAGRETTTLTISHSGRTVETLASTRNAKLSGATTIVITNFGRSPLLDHADIVLHTAAQETRYRMEAMSSRIAQLAVIDALYASIALKRWEPSLKAIDTAHRIIATKRV
ncbi:MAG: MurR/RpiR family transcriptional regulator [Pseudorhodoplanes sp.]|nr:MurR/RpiR family transcriptional regulator [Pseudorhodoplanes sp.]